MKPSTAAAFCVLSFGLAFSARADDPASPPAPPPAVPPAAQTSPAAEPDTAPQHRRHIHPAFVLGELTEKLALTPDQQKQVGEFIDEGAAKSKEARADETLSKEDKRAKVMGITKATREQIRGVLTPDQQKKFDALHAQGGRPNPPPTEATPPTADPKPPASN